MDRNCNIQSKIKGETFTIIVEGNLMRQGRKKLSAISNRLFNTSQFKKIQIDFQNLETFDSSGIAGIVELIILSQKKNLNITFINTPSYLKKNFEVIGLDSYITFNDPKGD